MKNDNFQDWIKNNLEEETQGICFSEQAREKVRQSIRQSVHPDNKEAAHYPGWWNRRISLPFSAVAFCLAALLLLTGIYARTFFYVSPQEIARFETQPKIILNNGDIPFGALQHELTASLEQGKGVGRP